MASGQKFARSLLFDGGDLHLSVSRSKLTIDPPCKQRPWVMGPQCRQLRRWTASSQTEPNTGEKSGLKKNPLLKKYILQRRSEKRTVTDSGIPLCISGNKKMQRCPRRRHVFSFWMATCPFALRALLLRLAEFGCVLPGRADCVAQSPTLPACLCVWQTPLRLTHTRRLMFGLNVCPVFLWTSNVLCPFFSEAFSPLYESLNNLAHSSFFSSSVLMYYWC